MKLADGRELLLPHPHCLHQNLVALHTGLRHNHIQWLDATRFDSLVEDDLADFALLLVNTDKRKDMPWEPHVNMRVIQLLRAQREWRNLIGEEGFQKSHFYNNNPSTKWPPILPLFSYHRDGRPHHDTAYLTVWQDMLCGLQGLLSDLGEAGRSLQLLRLLPPGIKADALDLKKRLHEYGSRDDIQMCQLVVKSRITPHSARVSVVSQFITFLPADVIGKAFTGQTPGVVAYYVHLERETVDAERAHQAARIREAALRNAFEPVLTGNPAAGPFVQADHVNSNLARGLKKDLEQTIARFGCMSISFDEDALKGLEVFIKTQGVEAAANKTEICPYDNNCPVDVVKQLRGFRRCGLCSRAVRSIDHLPAIAAKIRQVAESVDELERILADDAKTTSQRFTSSEIDALEEQRAQLCEELTGWILNQEVLEQARQRLAAGEGTRQWTVPKPEVLERELRAAKVSSTMTDYLLARLGECVAFPTLESAQIRARFDLLRRELLARAGSLKAAFSAPPPPNPAAELAGALRSLVEASGLGIGEIAEMLEGDGHLSQLPMHHPRLLTQDS